MSDLLSTPTPTSPQAGKPQGYLLMLMSCLPNLGAVLLAPILPTMQDHFGKTGPAQALVPLSLTVPALMIAVLAPLAGAVVDRFGRKRLLVGALAAYAVLGTAPLWLNGLVAIVVSRAGVGVAEAAIMTCCTTLIADYFSGAERDRWLGLQTVFASISATVFLGLGGALGAHGWRTPFWLYICSLGFAALAARMLPRSRPAGVRHDSPEPTGAEPLPPLPWSRLVPPCLVTIFGGIVFYTPIVELPYILDDAGNSTVAIGVASAVASACTAGGAFTFGRIARRGTAVLLPIAFALAGAGLLLVAVAPVLPLIVLGAMIASAGTGLLLPTLLTWALSGLTYEDRGRGTGLWTAALFLGEFACPLVVLGLGGALGGLTVGVAAVALIALVFAVGTRLCMARRIATIA